MEKEKIEGKQRMTIEEIASQFKGEQRSTIESLKFGEILPYLDEEGHLYGYKLIMSGGIQRLAELAKGYLWAPIIEKGIGIIAYKKDKKSYESVQLQTAEQMAQATFEREFEEC